MAPPTQMTPAEARVVDPVLTTVARGYRHQAHVWPFLFPIARTGARGGRIVTFGSEDFAEMALERAPGADRQTVTYGHRGDPYALTQRALDGTLPIEDVQDARAVPGIDLGRGAVRRTMNTVSLQIEIRAAKLATKASSYPSSNKETLAGTDQWSHADAEPAKKVKAAKEAIATAIAMEPNVMIVGPAVHRELTECPDVIDRIKHTEGLDGSRTPLVNEAKLAQYFDVANYRVGWQRSGKPGAFTPVWGKFAVLAYSEISDLAEMGSPSYGYCYRLEGYPIASPPWYDRTCDSWRYPVTTEDTPVIAGITAGYLFSAAVA